MGKPNLREFLQTDKPKLSDGAIATSLYDKGFYINRSFEELSLVEPEAVKEVSQGFRRSGAQFIGTNTFSATLPKLTEFGIQDQLEDIITKSVEISKSVADDDSYVLGTIGPLPVVIEPLGPTAFQEAIDHYQKNAQYMENAGVDGFSLEGFHNLRNLEAAVIAVKNVSEKPVFAHMGIQENMKSSYGNTTNELASLGDDYDIDVLGFAGEVGPSGMLTAVRALRSVTSRLISLRPNAGLPQYVNDQYIYLCNPDYMGKYAKRFVQAGANIIGGHCGVKEEHIKAVANSLKMTATLLNDDKTPPSFSHVIQPVNDEPQDMVHTRKRSKLGRYLNEGKRVFSVEVVPPKGVDINKFLEHCKSLENGGVEFINIPDGARAVARMSSLQMSNYVLKHFDIEPIPHFTSRDRNIIGIQGDLLGTHINGVRNVLLVTGDPPKLGNCKGASGVYDVDAIGMTHIVNRLNQGLDLGGSSFGKPTEFMIGVALNPTASNQELEISRFKYKVEAGADFAITQPIYDLEAYQKFFDQIGDVNIPIIMGIWPLVSLRNAEFLRNEVPGVEVPDWAIREMEKAGDSKEEALKRGTEIAVKTLQEAKDIVAGFQVSAPFNKVDISIDVIHSL